MCGRLGTRAQILTSVRNFQTNPDCLVSFQWGSPTPRYPVADTSPKRLLDIMRLEIIIIFIRSSYDVKSNAVATFCLVLFSGCNHTGQPNSQTASFSLSHTHPPIIFLLLFFSILSFSTLACATVGRRQKESWCNRTTTDVDSLWPSIHPTNHTESSMVANTRF